jgi:hypothetical protein
MRRLVDPMPKIITPTPRHLIVEYVGKTGAEHPRPLASGGGLPIPLDRSLPVGPCGAAALAVPELGMAGTLRPCLCVAMVTC